MLSEVSLAVEKYKVSLFSDLQSVRAGGSPEIWSSKRKHSGCMEDPAMQPLFERADTIPGSMRRKLKNALTKTSTFIIGPVATLLGYIMNAIFWVQSQIGIESIGLCIILFTIVIYMLLLPLTIKQQKFSRLQSKMNPELQAIQKKYKGKNQDQAAMMKMNEETQAVYQKYGVNPMGSCLQMVIQMPILFALYRVIWNIPAYVTSVKNYLFRWQMRCLKQTERRILWRKLQRRMQLHSMT